MSVNYQHLLGLVELARRDPAKIEWMQHTLVPYLQAHGHFLGDDDISAAQKMWDRLRREGLVSTQVDLREIRGGGYWADFVEHASSFDDLEFVCVLAIWFLLCFILAASPNTPPVGQTTAQKGSELESVEDEGHDAGKPPKKAASAGGSLRGY